MVSRFSVLSEGRGVAFFTGVKPSSFAAMASSLGRMSWVMKKRVIEI